MKVIKNCIVCLGLMLSGLALTASADSNWQLRKDKEGIQVYTRTIEGSPHDAVKAITRVENLSLTSLVALLDDVEACDDWADRCVESTVFKRVSDTEAYVYTHNDLPFPVKDRDVLTHVVWTQNPDTREVVMSSRATTGLMAKVKGRLRLTDATTRWRFRPLPSGKIEVSNESHINPGSSLPGWVTNMLLIETPYETIKSFVAEARKPKYQRAEVSFVADDSASVADNRF